MVDNFIYSQKLDQPRGPWRLAFQVYNGTFYTWDAATIGYDTMWALFKSEVSYTPADPSSYEPYKSSILQDWEEKKISVQAIKMSFIKDNREDAFIVFNGFGKTKSTWFSCDNILYASYTDLPDAHIAEKVHCPGTTTSGFPLTIQNKTFHDGPCFENTGWAVVADTNLGYSVCFSTYAPFDGPEPYFKYSKLTRIATDLTTELEWADSLEIYLQVWDMVFKGIDGIKPAAPSVKNLTDLWLWDVVENENDPSALTLTYSPVKTYKSELINNWENYYIDMVKFSMFDDGIEKAFFVFDGRGSDTVTWFTDDNILYTNYDVDGHLSMDVCSIEGDSFRHWQIQEIADLAGCTDSEQLGWMLVKEPRNNGTCPWDILQGKVKPYFLYNPQPGPANPETFQNADVMAVFVHGWRLVMKVSAGISVSPSSSVYSLWTGSGTLNEDSEEAQSLVSGTLAYKSAVVDLWDSLIIRAVKIAAYKNGVEEFYIVFDAGGDTSTSWFDCSRVLYTSVNGLDRDSLSSYTCSIQDGDSSLSFLIGTDPLCNSLSATGAFAIIDGTSTCSSRNDKPQIIFSKEHDATISDVPSGDAQLADTFAIFLDIENCWEGLCKNGATCDDRGGNFYCFCTGMYYGKTCLDLDGEYQEWTAWSECTVTCGGGTSTRTRECIGAEGGGQCPGAGEESLDCNTDPCPIDGGFSDWTSWSDCTEACGTGTRNRSRDCDSPAPQHGGEDCDGDTSGEELCNTHQCPIDGGWTDWTTWTECTVTCSGGEHSRSRECNNPAPQYGGNNCSGNSTETEDCNTETCPPVDGGWGTWSNWSVCYDLDSRKCGNGLTVRTRACDNPYPQYGGDSCVGKRFEIDVCIESCPNIECDPGNPSECEITYNNTGSTLHHMDSFKMNSSKCLLVMCVIVLHKTLSLL